MINSGGESARALITASGYQSKWVECIRSGATETWGQSFFGSQWSEALPLA